MRSYRDYIVEYKDIIGHKINASVANTFYTSTSRTDPAFVEWVKRLEYLDKPFNIIYATTTKGTGSLKNVWAILVETEIKERRVEGW